MVGGNEQLYIDRHNEASLGKYLYSDITKICPFDGMSGNETFSIQLTLTAPQ